MVMIIKAAEGSFIVVFLISFQKAQPWYNLEVPANRPSALHASQ
jgi:uncharacterized protein (DUF486 family)